MANVPDFQLMDNAFVIAEVAQAHDGSLGMAHAFIDAIANVGADAVKFQTHIASAESTSDEPWRVKFSKQDSTRYDYWQRMEFSEDQWHGLKKHADDRGIMFFSSPFSTEAAELLTRVGVFAWKIASGEVNNVLLFEKIIETGLPILLSTGMSSLSEVDTAVERVKVNRVPLVVLQCTSAYPCPPEKVGLNMLQVFKERYDCPVGLSDHSGTIYPGLAAATLGAALIEVHVTLSREMFGPDVVASINTIELSQLVEGVRFINKMNNHPVNKNNIATEMEPLRQVFTKSIYASVALSEGTVLLKKHLSAKKPGTGIPAERMAEIIGKRIKRGVLKDEMLNQDDIE